MRLKYKDDDIKLLSQVDDGWYAEGHFFIQYYSKKMKICVKKEITNYVDEEMKTYFKLLDLLDKSIWALSLSLFIKMIITILTLIQYTERIR